MILKRHNSKGFIALVSTMLLMTGVFAFVVVTSISVYMYSDMRYRSGIRAQARQNLETCIETMSLLVSRDYFIIGTTSVKELGCNAYVSNDFAGNRSFTAVAELSRIKEFSAQ